MIVPSDNGHGITEKTQVSFIDAFTTYGYCGCADLPE